MPRDRDADRTEESRRILGQIAREADAGGILAPTGGNRRGDARRKDQGDPIEYWGTRIGRFLGMAITIAVIVWVFTYLVRGL